MSQNHVIQKVFVEITVSNKEKAHYIKNDINGFLSVDVFPEIEKYINDIESQLAGRTLQIPLLEMDLDIKNSSLNTELKDKIAELFKEKLSEIINSVEISDEKKRTFQALLDQPSGKNVTNFYLFFRKRINALVEFR